MWPDCIRGGLTENAPCVDNPTIYWGIDHRKLHWHNIATGQQGDTNSDTNGTFTVNTGSGEISATIYKPLNGIGQASANYTT